MLTAGLLALAVDYHKNGGSLARMALQAVSQHVYKDVYDVLVSPGGAMFAWLTLVVMLLGWLYKKARG